MTQKTGMGLHKKLLRVLKATETIKKSGLNKALKYQYMTEADILEAIKKQLVENDIFIFSSVEHVQKEQDVTTVRMKHSFVDCDSGEQFDVFSCGQGHDRLDKGVYKAITGSMKYMLSKNFLIASQDDPESDGANSSYIRPQGKTVPPTATTINKPVVTTATTATPPTQKAIPQKPKASPIIGIKKAVENTEQPKQVEEETDTLDVEVDF